MGIKKNFIYSLILTASNYIFPLLVYPYISRVLGVDKIGICNFVDSIINYFVLFSTIGISIIGIREIAFSKQEQHQLNTVYTSLLMQTLIPTLLTSIVFVILVFNVERFLEYKWILLIGLGKIWGTAFLLDWFYKGIENFKYITIRTITIKVVYVVSVFLLVRKPGDYIIFFSLTTVMVLVNSVFNLVYSKKFVKLNFDYNNFKNMIKPNLINGIYLFLNTMYTTLNVAFLGFVSTVTQVGYYTTATKVFSIILAAYSAFTGVMLPRMSSLLSEKKFEDFKILIEKSVSFLISFSIPLVIVCSIVSSEIIYIISGSGYEGAYIPAVISMPLIFIIGYEQILVVQVLTPLKQDKIKLKNSIVGAIVGVAGNLLLVKHFLAIGATIVWALSEIAVLLSAQYYVSKLIGLSFPFKELLRELFYYSPLGLLVYYIHTTFSNPFFALLSVIIFTILYYLCVQVVIKKDVYTLGIIRTINKTIKGSSK